MKVVLKLSAPGQEIFFEVSQKPVSLGRGDDADIRVDDMACSRLHCIFFTKDNKLWVEDSRSKNGTTLNGKLIAKSRFFLQDKIRIGDTRISVSPERTEPGTVKLLTYQGSIEDRLNKPVVLEDQEAISRIRHNPLKAMKEYNATATTESRRQMTKTMLFGGSIEELPSDERNESAERPTQLNMPSWLDDVALWLDRVVTVLVMLLPIFFRPWVMKTGLIDEGLSGTKQLLSFIALSATLGVIFWQLNQRNSGGTLGKRLVKILVLSLIKKG